MKTSVNKSKQDRGIALIITVILVAFAALYFVTYLILTANEYNTVGRSQTWNDSLTVAEAGVEEGLALVNQYAFTTTTISNWTTSATADGWTYVSSSTVGTNSYQVYSISRSLPNSTCSYTVYVTNLVNGAYPYGLPTILSIGTVTNVSVPSVSRSILVQTAATSQLAGGVVAQDGVTEHGGIVVDSWDSSTNIHSIWQSNYVFRANYFSRGMSYGLWSNSLSYVSNSYPSRTANVCVFTDSNAVDVIGNTTIAGYLQTGPNGTATLNGNTSVGDLAWCFTSSGGKNQTGLESGHWEEDANMNFHSYPLPVPTNTWQSTWTNVPSPASGSAIKIGGIWWYTNSVWTNIGGTYYTNTGSGFNIGGTTYNYVITNRLQNTNYVYYSMGQLAHGQSLFVDAQYVVLYLTNGITYQSHDTLTVNTNADLQVWSTGNISTTAQSVINNFGNYTHAFSVYDVAGTPISVSLGGGATATGYYYLPSSTLSFNGGGDFVGAIICYSIDDGGGMNIHFDQSLSTYLPPDQYTPAAWTEIAPN